MTEEDGCSVLVWPVLFLAAVWSVIAFTQAVCDGEPDKPVYEFFTDCHTGIWTHEEWDAVMAKPCDPDNPEEFLK